LGPLADNGGPTLTHALLPGSFALDWGDTNLAVDVTNGNAPLTVDQRGAPFYRVFGRTVDIGAFEHQPFRTTSGGANAFLTGTAGNDAIVYDAEHQRVNINGLAYPILPGTRLLTIDAGEGSDTVNVIGSTANDLVTADLRTQLVTFTHGRSPNGADARIVGAEVVVIDGNGGNDAATLQDSPGDDKFFARPGSGFFVDLARVLEVDLFRMNLHAQAGGGHNLARLFGSTGIDVLTAQAATSTLMGPGFAHSASGFDFVQVQGGVGTDTATLTGSSGVDALIARAGVAVLTTGGVNVQLDGFETINADGRGGSDFLRLIGSPGNDSLTAFPGSSQFVTNGYNYGFTSFERLTASVAGGGADTAVLIDSVGDDLFVGSGDLAELSGVGFFSRTTGFDVVRIRGVNGGTNTRRVSSINYQLIEQGTWV
ncbi:MAG: hypothetical protein KDA75_12805, partial [Planctomycetaceae bacterium]|nr:hypothetical protein [Planctomycetaceae bacterium]